MARPRTPRIPCLFVLLSLAAPATGSMAFPEDAVVDVTKAPYGATPNDDTDDTAAFQKALAETPKNMLIYVPDGTYIVSETLRWGDKEKRQILQGQSQAGTVLRLKNNCPGFVDPASPRAVVWTGKRPAQRFRNGIRDLTISTGKGNAGAIGLQFIANNQGGVTNVTIRSEDEHGLIGLDLGYTDEQGPCLIRGVRVVGFGIGISTKHAVDSVTLEDVSVEGQRVCGFVNDGQCISMRRFHSVNAVPAYRNVKGASLTAIIDSDLIGQAGAEQHPAILNEAALFARNVKTSGYARAIDNQAGHKRSADGPVVDEFVSHEVLSLFEGPKRSLGLPINETPDVAWDPPDKWTPVTKFGPPRQVDLVRQTDGKRFRREDWSEALQKAIDSGATTIYLPRLTEGDYGLYGTVRLRGNVRRVIGCENTLGRLVDSNEQRTAYQPELRPVFVLDDGAAPVVVVERFDTWYAAPRFEQRSGRTLVVRSMSFYDLATTPGGGDVFLEDVRTRELRVNGSRLWGRQVNAEGWEEPRILCDAGQVWILGLKTETDATIAQAVNGGRLEIVGGFVYANKAQIEPKQMFINRDSSISFTVGEWVIRDKPFDIIEETHNGLTRRLLKGQAYARGLGAAVPLYVGSLPSARAPAARP